MIGVIRSEWLKLRTIRAVWVISVFVVGLPLLIISIAPRPDTSTLLSSAIPGILLIGVIGVMCATQEYSQGTIRVTLAATPNRYVLFVAKAVVMVFVALVMSGVILAISHLTQSPNPTWEMSDRGRQVGAYLIVTVLVAVCGLSLGILLRSSPGAISLIVLWPTLVESLVGGLLMVIFDWESVDWLPFSAGLASMFDGLSEPTSGPSMAEGLGYLGILVGTILVAGVALFNRRDA